MVGWATVWFCFFLSFFKVFLELGNCDTAESQPEGFKQGSGMAGEFSFLFKDHFWEFTSAIRMYSSQSRGLIW